MKFVSKTLVLATALFMLGQSAQSQGLHVAIEADGYTEADAKLALEIFRRECRPLGDAFWEDVTDVEVVISEEVAGYRQRLGWKNSIHLAVKYSDKPAHGPAYASGPGVLAGHTLHYFLGGGDLPGFFAGKRSSQYLCGLAFHPKGDDIFVEVPELKFIDR